MYCEFCQCTIAEVDKYINYKSQGKMLRKKFKSYKPFWNSELTSLWKDMCHKERSARCLTSNLQHKLEDRLQKKKIMFLHSKNKASRKGYKGEC